MQEPSFSAEEMLSSLIDLPLHDQVSALEQIVNESDMAEIIDILSLCLMTIGLGLDDTCPADLRQRFEAIVSKVRQFNQARFGTDTAAE